MKKTPRTARPSLDTDHLARLHQEAATVLSLLVSALSCASFADGEVRDTLDNIAQDHLTAYLDLLHTISLHDATIGTYFSAPPSEAPMLSISRDLRLHLAEMLVLQHRRLEALARTTDSKRFYQDDTLAREKEHLAELVRLLAM